MRHPLRSFITVLVNFLLAAAVSSHREAVQHLEARQAKAWWPLRGGSGAGRGDPPAPQIRDQLTITNR